MRTTITVSRKPRSCGSYLIATDVADILVGIDGISAVTIDHEFLDGANVSYTSLDSSFERIDQLLSAKGLRRV